MAARRREALTDEAEAPAQAAPPAPAKSRSSEKPRPATEGPPPGGRTPSGKRTPRSLWRSRRFWLWLVLGSLATLILLVTVGSYLFDGPLRSQLEARMNKNLNGYSLQLGHAHANLVGLSLTLRGVVMRQRQFPNPPVATIPRLHLRVEWPSLFSRHVVGDATFDRPLLHLDSEQLAIEEARRIRLGERGWQKALESIFPVKFNKMIVNDGAIVYVDGDPAHPLEITQWNLRATNIRNIEFPDRVYPSPIHTEGAIFGTGRGVIDGNANFLAEPYPGIHARYGLRRMPLAPLGQLGSDSGVQLHDGMMSSNGEVEYAPRVKLVDIAELLLEGVRLDYVHTAANAAADRRRAQAVAAAAKKADQSEAVLRLNRLRLTGGQVGFVNRAANPPYRLFVEGAELDMQHVSNRVARDQNQVATASLRGRFMGSGSANVKATFRPGEPGTGFGAEVAIEHTSLPALNDLLRAYQKIEVESGTVSVYSQIEVKNRQIHGYVKALFHEIKVATGNDRAKPFSAKLKEKVVNVLASVLENHKSDDVATRIDLSGPVSAPHTSATLSSLLRNAFFKGIVPGFDNATHPGHGGHAAAARAGK
jgi:hypothetical protein